MCLILLEILLICQLYGVFCWKHPFFEKENYSTTITFKPVSSLGCEIFRPLLDSKQKDNIRGIKTVPSLFAAPETFITVFKRNFKELDAITTGSDSIESITDRAQAQYLELTLSIITAKAYGTSEKSILPLLRSPKGVSTIFNETLRESGDDHSYLGMTMVGVKRIRNIQTLLLDVFAHGIPGGVVETGVWRGGASIFAKAVIRAYNQNDRYSYLCDSFAGLPAGDVQYHPDDVGWDKTPYLEVNEKEVENNFKKLNLLDNKVVFVKGFFNNTMPILSTFLVQHDQKISILRLDGDIYQSTVDVLYHLYDKLSIGGYVIMDDWFGFPAKIACEDFFRIHSIAPTIVVIDQLSVYWQKNEEVVINMDAYKNKQFKPPKKIIKKAFKTQVAHINADDLVDFSMEETIQSSWKSPTHKEHNATTDPIKTKSAAHSSTTKFTGNVTSQNEVKLQNNSTIAVEDKKSSGLQTKRKKKTLRKATNKSSVNNNDPKQQSKQRVNLNKKTGRKGLLNIFSWK